MASDGDSMLNPNMTTMNDDPQGSIGDLHKGLRF